VPLVSDSSVFVDIPTYWHLEPASHPLHLLTDARAHMQFRQAGHQDACSLQSQAVMREGYLLKNSPTTAIPRVVVRLIIAPPTRASGRESPISRPRRLQAETG